VASDYIGAAKTNAVAVTAGRRAWQHLKSLARQGENNGSAV